MSVVLKKLQEQIAHHGDCDVIIYVRDQLGEECRLRDAGKVFTVVDLRFEK